MIKRNLVNPVDKTIKFVEEFYYPALILLMVFIKFHKIEFIIINI